MKGVDNMKITRIRGLNEYREKHRISSSSVFIFRND